MSWERWALLWLLLQWPSSPQMLRTAQGCWMLLSRRTSEFRELAVGVIVVEGMAWLAEMLHMAIAME
jgi:hypothetical protein